MDTLEVKTSRRSQMIDITGGVEAAVRRLKVEQGCVMVFVPHTTAGVTINEAADPAVAADMLDALERLVPWEAGWRHAEGNAAAHVKTTLVGSSVQVVVEGGRLVLGRWQGIFFCEFDGPRTRRVQVSACHPLGRGGGR
jgi:secondary thiamine-phosphate synthase enzyme